MQQLLKFLLLFSLSTTVAAQPRGIILIGNPRGLTTAFERYMINRGDFKVYHEPLVTHTYSKLYPDYFKSPFAANCDGDCILQQIYAENSGPFFIKEIASFLIDTKTLIQMAKDSKLQIMFLIRKPEQAVLSHFKLRSSSPWVTKFNVTEHEANYKHMHKLFFELKAALNKNPILIDADELLDNPELVLNSICTKLGIGFDKEALHWPAGESKLWSNDVSSWQFNVTNSTGFKRSSKMHSLEDIPEPQRAKLHALIQSNNKIYAKLINYR